MKRPFLASLDALAFLLPLAFLFSFSACDENTYLLSLGAPCQEDSECADGLCLNHYCADPRSNEAPKAPSINASSPASPNKDSKTPSLSGSSELELGRVLLYDNNPCNKPPIASGPIQNGQFEVKVAVASNSETLFYAQAENRWGALSPCSTKPFSYRHDDIPPAFPLVKVSPTSPSKERDIQLEIESNEAIQIYLFSHPRCEESSLLFESEHESKSHVVDLKARDNADTLVFLVAKDSAQNSSPCEEAFLFVHDSIPPDAPSLDISPSSPSEVATPEITVRSERRSEVKLFDNGACSGEPIDEAQSLDGESLFRVAVPRDELSHFSALAIDLAGNISPCSEELGYQHASEVPMAPHIESFPPSPSSEESPAFVIEGDETSKDALIRLYAGPGCEGEPLSAAPPDENGVFSSFPSIELESDNFYSADLLSPYGIPSPCSDAFLYRHDSIPPELLLIALSPLSPSQQQKPELSLESEESALLRIYSQANCEGDMLLETVASESELTVRVPLPEPNQDYALSVEAQDEAGNSTCKGPLHYRHSDDALLPPRLRLLQHSPSNQVEFQLLIETEGPGKLEVYHDQDCSESLEITAELPNDAPFELIFPLLAEKNQMNHYYVKWLQSEFAVSPCVGPVEYEHDDSLCGLYSLSCEGESQCHKELAIVSQHFDEVLDLGGFCHLEASPEEPHRDMVFVDGQEAVLGGCPDPGLYDCSNASHPKHAVYLSPFLIDRTLVTALDYEACVDNGFCDNPFSSDSQNATFKSAEKAQHPINFVNWDMASRYCEWLGKRLPTEAEWELAARGSCRTLDPYYPCEDSMRTYPWGQNLAVACEDANFNYCTMTGSTGYTTPVDQFPSAASPYGLLDVIGNLREWTQDWYEDFAELPPLADPIYDPKGPPEGLFKVVKGGGDFSSPRERLFPSARGRNSPQTASDGIGFRCVLPCGESGCS